MSTLVEIEQAALRLTPAERQQLLFSLARGLRQEQTLPPHPQSLPQGERNTDVDPLTTLPVVRVPPGTKTFTPEDVRRATDEDD